MTLTHSALLLGLAALANALYSRCPLRRHVAGAAAVGALLVALCFPTHW